MSEKLVIVESPAKAKTIGKILGKDYRIMASMGHVRDLPQHSFGVDIKNDFTPQYKVTKGREKVVRDLKAAAKGVDEIYLAPDPDREGEAIAWHLQETLKKGSKAKFKRVTFHEITKGAINKAFENTTDIDMNLVDSQQARRVLDRLVGYQISPLLWSRIEKGISAGRVQSVALRITCEREREILAFEPKEYWNFTADLEAVSDSKDKAFTGKIAKIDGKKFEIGNKEDADGALEAVKGNRGLKVASVDVSPRKRNAPPPFITSTLQQAASAYLGSSANATMRTAQSLYEGVELGSGGPTGLITYMRTDSFNIAQEAQAACRGFIASEFGQDFVPQRPNFFKSKASAQEAHEAIRPTDVNQTPERLKPYLDSSQLRLYTLIWKRFVASQMAPAQQKRTTVDVDIAGADNKVYSFRTVATVTTFPGFTKVLGKNEEDEDNKGPAILAELKAGDPCVLKDLKGEQKFTEPPPRYSEATLIRELEANGIGRPSTYAAIVNTIQNRKYVNREKGKLIPSELGFKVNDFLVSSLPELFQIGFTADMESKLDNIEEGDLEWTVMLNEFYSGFSHWVDEAKNLGAPEGLKAQKLIDLMENVSKWEEPVKKGRRTYDDKKFFTSVKEKFEKDSKITARQWEALLRMAVIYSDQLPNLDATAAEFEFTEELASIKEKVAEQKEKQAKTTASGEDKEKYDAIFSAFEKIEWAEPEKRKNRTYDDKKFFTSLKDQAESGKILSEKQMGVLERFAVKYKEQITDFEKVMELMGVDKAKMAEDAEKAAEQNKEVEEALAVLDKVQEWAEPVKKGRRTYDDKEFYKSIQDQYKAGKRLSPKQVFAVKKLVTKYTSKDS